MSDSANNAVRRIAADGTVTTVAGGAGLGGPGGHADGDAITTAQFSDPRGIGVCGRSGTIFVGDYGNHSVRKIEAGCVTTVVTELPNGAGTGLVVEIPGPKTNLQLTVVVSCYFDHNLVRV